MTQDDDTLSAASAGSMANHPTKHDGSPEPKAHLPNTGHAGCRSRESDAGTGDIVEHRWISVTERLPEEGVEVLVWLGDEIATAKHIGAGHWFVPKIRISTEPPDPTHWMPPPAPPPTSK